MKCIAIDDEPYALDLLRDYIIKTPFLQLCGEFSNPLKALSFLMNEKVDLVFLDINMPELSGIQLLKSLPARPLVIFTTAYSEYGAESYEYDAVDYLVKPVKYERFLKAVTKASDKLKEKNIEKSIPVSNIHSDESVYIKSGTKIHKVSIKEILFIEGAGNYMAFHTVGKKILSLLSMKELLDLMPGDIFIRVHKSYVISINHIELIESHRIVINKTSIPIGITYREQFFSKIGNKI